MSVRPTTSGPHSDMDHRTAELIEAAAELMLLSRRSRPDDGRHEWKAFAATVLPDLFKEDLSGEEILNAVETAARQEGIN